MIYNVLDYETRSEADLELVGAYEYARHPSTEILCAAWKAAPLDELADASTKAWCPRIGLGSPQDLVDLFRRRDTMHVAHNAFFEQCITRFVLPRQLDIKLPELPPSRWICSAALAATHALPRPLEGSCDVLKLPVQKNPRGRLLIRRHCMPQKPPKRGSAKWWLWDEESDRWNNDPAGLRELSDYNVTDTDAATGLFLTLPPLTKLERRLWVVDQEMNFRGIAVDRELVASALKLVAEETKSLTTELIRVTEGRVDKATKVKALVDFVAAEGCKLPNLQAKTVEDAIKAGLVSGRALRALEIRQALGKTSTAKYQAFWSRTATDGRLRDHTLWHGASTGRDAGAGVQVQNFPQGKVKDTEGLVEAIKTGNLAWVRALYGDPMAALSSALRPVLRATPGYDLFCGDFNAIEARKVFWMAGHHAGLRMFASGQDLYVEMAAVIYRKPASRVTAAERDVGKRAILGCGFGMGWKKFQMTCEKYGNPVSAKVAKAAVAAYRRLHKPVPDMWKAVERAAKSAVLAKGKKKYTAGKTTWVVEGKFLYCTLPSGRRLAYFKPFIKSKETPWGEMKPTLHFWGVDPKTKQWKVESTHGGSLTENVVQASARDVMKEASLRLLEARYELLMGVHDESLTERLKGRGSIAEFERLQSMVPVWAKGLPVKAKAWTGERYRK